jgi:glycosyltransferase involved in cell wall biosynthesis
MKAKIVEFKHDYVLSIGMIVKNEETYLHRCLTALKPLTDAVSSELIIVDTGSTDKTVEIAKSFTDKVEHFEWINDFAAARNCSLEKAKGEWFMFIDADEIFDVDMSEMIEFFNSDKSKEFNTCFYAIRNYTMYGDSQYVVVNSQRIARRVPGLRFTGEIHEQFDHATRVVKPDYIFKTFVNHYGYNYKTPEEKEAKSKRNLEISYKMLEKNPKDIKIICEVIDSLNNQEEKEQYIPRAIEAAKEYGKSLGYIRPYQIAMGYYMKTAPNKTVEYADEYISLADGDETHLVDAYALKAVGMFNANRFGEVKESADKYREFFRKSHNGELNNDSSKISVVSFLDDGKYKFVNEITGVSLAEVGRYEEAFQYLSESERPFCSRVFYLAMKHGFDVSAHVDRLNQEQMEASLKELAEKNADCPRVLLDNCVPELFTASIKRLLWAVHALEFASLRCEAMEDSCGLDYDEKVELYSRFISLAAVFVRNVYNPDLLNDSDIGVLPALHRFGYYVLVAQQSLEKGDKLGYIRSLKKALDNYISMKDVIAFMLKDFSKNL